MEIWLRTNPRPYWAALIIPLVLLVGCAGCLSAAASVGAMWPYGWAGSVLGFLAVALTGMFLWRAQSPVLVRDQSNLLLHFGAAPPVAIPIEVVECFFVGHGDTLMKDRLGKEVETSTIILRIAESAKEWHHREVAPAFAHWCEGYITLKGTWCEPIGPDLLRALNQRLVATQRNLKQRSLKASNP
jgi:hypothetical protein